MAERTQACNGERGQYFGLLLTYTENSTSVANNTSNVTITGTIRATSSGYSYFGATSTGKLYIDGTQVTSGSSTATVDTSGVRLFNWTGDIQHNSDGKKTATVKFVFDTTYGRLTETTMEFNWTLTEIPRASSISLSASAMTLNNTTGTLTYTVTSKGNFWHKLVWSVGSLSSTIWTAQSINATSKSGTVNFGQILDKLPTSTSGTVTFTVTTYTDSGATQQSGTASASCSVTIDTGAIKPSVSLGNIGVNSPSSFTNLVAGHSTAKMTSTTTNSRGASAVTTRFTISKGSMSASSTTSTSYTATTATLPASTSNYTFTITAQSTDSRGVKSASVTKTSPTVYAYASPVLTVNFYRVNASGETTPDPAGEWVYIQFSAVQNYKVNNWNTTLTVTGKKDGSTVTSGTWAQLSETASSTLVVTATDKVSSTEKSVTIGTARFPLDLIDDTNGQVGVGMGVTAEYNKVKSNMEIDVVDGNGVVQSAMYPSGNIYARNNAVVGGKVQATGDVTSGGKVQATGNVTAGGNVEATGSGRAQKGFWSLPTGQVGTPTDSSGMLIVKRANNTECPNNGVVLEYGNSTSWKGQLYIGDNATQGAYINGWSNGTRGTWKKLMFQDDYRTQNTFITTGLTYYNSRVSLSSGGYFTSGKMVYVSLYLKMGSSTMGHPSDWMIVQGLPAPARNSALACAVVDKDGSYGAYVKTNGNLSIQTSSTSIASGDYIAITGFYFIA